MSDKSDEIYPPGTPLDFGKSPFPFVRVAGRDAVDALDRLSVTHQDQTPVIWGDDEETARLFELFNDPGHEVPSASDTLEKASSRPAAALYATYQEQVRESVAAFYRRLGKPNPADKLDDEPDPGPPRGTWPENIQTHELPVSLIDHRTKDFKKEVLIGLLPTSKRWAVAAYLGFGNWNRCPPPEVHVAYAREWYAAYGAKPILNSADTIEFYVERPIEDRDTAIEMALAHYQYCGDVIDQGVGTIDALAAHLYGAQYWYFWWD
ncbi:MAG: DUF4253 domain-containing protein [Pseudomonadota bacterium]